MKYNLLLQSNWHVDPQFYTKLVMQQWQRAICFIFQRGLLPISLASGDKKASTGHCPAGTSLKIYII